MLKKSMKLIKHLVIPGGAIYGFSYYGAIKYLCQSKFFDINDIKTIHATSVGSIIGTFIALKYDWEEIDNYIINRPWHLLFKFSLQSIIHCNKNNGIFDIDIIKEIFEPLFLGKEIIIDISMKDFYDLTNIELHFFTIEFGTFQLIDISYKTFPNWTVIESIYASCCAPILFKPLIKNNLMYVDGGIISNCPINQLFDDKTINPIANEVICIDTIPEKDNNFNIFTLHKFIITLLVKMIRSFQIIEPIPNVHNILIEQSIIPIYDVYSVVNSPEQRLRLIEHGFIAAKQNEL
jgi:predicted acylesterase/phospholipase RssA